MTTTLRALYVDTLEYITRSRGRAEKENSTAYSMDDAVVGLAKILDPVAACFTPEVAQRIVALRVDPAVHTRIALLADKCNEGTIAPEEMAEYEAYIHAMDVVAVLQKQARALLMQALPS
jgi:hypothetical protein